MGKGTEASISSRTTRRICNLAELPMGGQGVVVKLEGGPGFISRMAALGFIAGAKVTVTRNHGHGPIIVSILDTQIALGRGQAAKVHVKEQVP